MKIKAQLFIVSSFKEYSEQDTKMEGSCSCLDSGNVPKTSGKSPEEKGFNKECTDS